MTSLDLQVALQAARVAFPELADASDKVLQFFVINSENTRITISSSSWPMLMPHLQAVHVELCLDRIREIRSGRDDVPDLVVSAPEGKHLRLKNNKIDDNYLSPIWSKKPLLQPE